MWSLPRPRRSTAGSTWTAGRLPPRWRNISATARPLGSRRTGGYSATQFALTVGPLVPACYTDSGMHPDLTPIQRIDELDELLTDTGNRPVVLFKHSYSCGISAEA